jgi:hypothetical protein
LRLLPFGLIFSNLSLKCAHTNQRVGIVISEADTETLFFHVERAYGGPSALELSGTTLRKALGLPVSAAAQQLLDQQVNASTFQQDEDSVGARRDVSRTVRGQREQQQQYKAWQHTHPAAASSRDGGGLLSSDQRRACNMVAAKANTIIKLCAAVDSAEEGEVPWGAFSEAMTKAGISFQPDELEVVRRTLLGNPPTVEDPVMTDGYATGAAAAQAVGVEWRASIAYPSIVFKLRSLLENDQRTPKPRITEHDRGRDIGESEEAEENGSLKQRIVEFADTSPNMADADRAMASTGTPYEAQPPREGGEKDEDFQQAAADDAAAAAGTVAAALAAVNDTTPQREVEVQEEEPYDGYDGGGPGKLDVLARAPGGIALAFTGPGAEDGPLEGTAFEVGVVEEPPKKTQEVEKGTLAYYAAKRAKMHGPLPSQKWHGRRRRGVPAGETDQSAVRPHRTSAELADRQRGKRHTSSERASLSPSRAGVLSTAQDVYDESGTYNFAKLGRNFDGISLRPNSASGEFPLVLKHDANVTEGGTSQFKNHQGQVIKGRGRSTSADGRGINDSREFENAMLVKLGGQNGLGVGDEDDIAFREAIRRNAPEELSREAARWRHRRAIALQTLTQQRALLAGVFRRVDSSNSGVLNVAELAELLRSPGLDLALSADDYAVGNIDGALRLAAELVNSANEEEAERQANLDHSVGAFVEALDFNQLMRVVSREAQATVDGMHFKSSDRDKGSDVGDSEILAQIPSAGAPSEILASAGRLPSSNKNRAAISEPASAEVMDAIIAEKIRGTVRAVLT